MANWYMLTFQQLQWQPTEVASTASQRKKKSVFFRAPHADMDERGYQGTTFDVEYQLIACMGELHLAYSVVPNSVHSKRRVYFLEGSWHDTSTPAPTNVESVHLKGTVYIPPFTNEPIGTFSDPAAGEALGFGCFTGQTKKVAKLKDHVGPNPNPEQVKTFINKLEVSFRTTDVLTSLAAEQEIREGKAAKTSATKEGREQADAGPTEADLRAKRRAEKEAEFQAAVKKYEEDLAAQRTAVAKFNADTVQVAITKAAQAQRAQAAEAEYARQKAAHDAEVERYKREQGAYQATVAGQASIKKPNN
jgi:hypothetical protein